jgi:hypothetical protein
MPFFVTTELAVPMMFFATYLEEMAAYILFVHIDI